MSALETGPPDYTIFVVRQKCRTSGELLFERVQELAEAWRDAAGYGYARGKEGRGADGIV